VKAAHSTSHTHGTVRRWRYRSALHAARAIHAAGSLGQRESTVLVPAVPRPRAASGTGARDGER
jgi:hypothetical protein